MSEGVTTHVLNTSSEGSVVGIDVTLQKLDSSDEAETVDRGTTNDDRRVDEPLLPDNTMETGIYRLLFEVGPYYRDGPVGLLFLEAVPIRFVVDDTSEHYHISLSLPPGNYTACWGD